MSILGAETRRRAVIALGIGWLLLVAVTVVSACLSGCGAAPLGAAASCSGMYVAIGEHDYESAERARADLDQVTEVCDRLAVDAGAP